MSSTDFYQTLPSFNDFEEFSIPERYQPLPDDWFVVVTDVIGSTRAIEAGYYKQVNGIGVASIVALLNSVKPIQIPYVFGGDGATACFPSSLMEHVREALIDTARMSQEQFGLALRVGVVSMGEIRSGGSNVLVAKYQPHADFQQAMFLGDGLGYAEKLIKDPSDKNRYVVSGDSSENTDRFSGFECRWNEIPSPSEETIALMVQALAGATEQKDRIYAQVIQHVGIIYGNESDYHPLKEDHLSLALSPKLLGVEAGVRTAFKSPWERFKYHLMLQFRRLVGIWFMDHSVRTEHADWGAYKQQLIINTDYRKFDEVLRMVISGTASQRRQLRSVLDQFKAQDKIVYGIHADRSALITCIVNNYDKDHVHFLDGANGGYAMAAKELKQQLSEREPAT